MKSDKLLLSYTIESRKSSRISTGSKRSLTSGMKQPTKKMDNNKLNPSYNSQIRGAYIHTVSFLFIKCSNFVSIESNMSKRTAASGASFKKRVEAEKKAQGEKVEWDKSTVASEKKQ